MKKLVYGVAIIFTFLIVSTASPDYVIKLKNGRTVETEKYWEEKDMVMFQWEDGVASFPKKNILSIVKVEEKFSGRFYKEKDIPPAIQKAPAETEKSPEKEGVEKSAAVSEAPKKIDVGYYRKQKALYMGQYEQAYQRYLDASSRRDEEGKKKAWEEFNRYGGQVISLESELKQKNNGVVPQWWKE